MKYLFILLLTLFTLSIFAQPEKWNPKKHFTILSYNVENLFDTIAINKMDDEFTPNSQKKWNTERYSKKLECIAKVISSVNTNELPELVGLIEIENMQVLSDLVKTPAVAKGNYVPLLVEGPDPRGIDCGFLYRPDAFKYLYHKAIPVFFEGDSSRRTRDILYIKGLVKKDTVHIFVNHWTSRRGGDETDNKRIECAKTLKHFTDSILHSNLKSNIVIMGDFNDEPSNESLSTTLGAVMPGEKGNLINLMYPLHNQKKGTYYYKGEYNMLDNLIVSNYSFEKAKGFRVYASQGFIFDPEFLIFTQKNGDKAPNRTYGGNNYYGGYSDHYPIYATFYEK